MTKSLMVDEKNNLLLDSAGNLGIVSGIEAVIQNCRTAMSAQMNEMIYAMQEGMPTLVTAWEAYNPSQFEAASRRTLIRVEGVSEVLSFYSRQVDDVLEYEALIRTIYGETAINEIFFQ